MNDYDIFEAEMLEAGWSLDEIEAAWQKHLLTKENVSANNPSYDISNPEYILDLWDRD